MQVITNPTKRVRLVSSREAAVLLRIHPQCLENYIMRGVLTRVYRPVGGRKVRMFRVDEVRDVAWARHILKYDTKGPRRGRKPVSGLDHVAEVLANDLASKPYAAAALDELRDNEAQVEQRRAVKASQEQCVGQDAGQHARSHDDCQEQRVSSAVR